MLSVVQRKDQTNLVKEYRRLSLEHTRTVSQERFYRKLYEEKTNTEGLEREIALLQGRENGLKINLSSIIAAHNQILQSAMEPAVDCRWSINPFMFICSKQRLIAYSYSLSLMFVLHSAGFWRLRRRQFYSVQISHLTLKKYLSVFLESVRNNWRADWWTNGRTNELIL